MLQSTTSLRSSCWRRGTMLVGALVLHAASVCALAASAPPGDVPPPNKAETQEEAVAQAKNIDLPLVSSSDRIVITDESAGGNAKDVTLTKADDVKAFAATLKPEKRPPSGGTTAATVTFYKGNDKLRSIWVFSDGEWGFERPGVKWTTGKSGDLWKLIQEHLK